MNTRIEGHTKNSICITTKGKQEVVECKDSIVKLWLSSGTILGMKYGNMLDPYIWKIRVLHGPVDARYCYTQCWNTGAFDNNCCCGSDIFETEEEVVNMRIIPRANYMGDDV